MDKSFLQRLFRHCMTTTLSYSKVRFKCNINEIWLVPVEIDIVRNDKLLNLNTDEDFSRDHFSFLTLAITWMKFDPDLTYREARETNDVTGGRT